MQQPTRLQRLRAWWNVVAELTLGVRAEADKAFKTSKTTAAGIMKDELHNFPDTGFHARCLTDVEFLAHDMIRL